MKLVLHNYWRSSASQRVRIGLGLKSSRTSTSSSTSSAARAARRRATARATRWRRCRRSSHRGRRHAARSRSRCRSSSISTSGFPGPPLLPADRACARARAQLAEIVNSGIQPLQNLTGDAPEGGSASTRPRGRATSSRAASPRSRRPRPRPRARSWSATPQPRGRLPDPAALLRPPLVGRSGALPDAPAIEATCAALRRSPPRTPTPVGRGAGLDRRHDAGAPPRKFEASDPQSPRGVPRWPERC